MPILAPYCEEREDKNLRAANAILVKSGGPLISGFITNMAARF